MNFFDSHESGVTCTPRHPCRSCRVRNYLVERLHATEKDVEIIGSLLEIPEENGPRTRLLADLDLSIRAKSVLTRNGMLTLGSVADKTQHELLRLENFGRKSLNEMREVLTEHGLAFKPDEP